MFFFSRRRGGCVRVVQWDFFLLIIIIIIMAILSLPIEISLSSTSSVCICVNVLWLYPPSKCRLSTWTIRKNITHNNFNKAILDLIYFWYRNCSLTACKWPDQTQQRMCVLFVCFQRSHTPRIRSTFVRLFVESRVVQSRYNLMANPVCARARVCLCVAYLTLCKKKRKRQTTTQRRYSILISRK